MKQIPLKDVAEEKKQKKVLWKAFNLVQCIGNILVMAGAIPSA